jgi:hypothetical protein
MAHSEFIEYTKLRGEQSEIRIPQSEIRRVIPRVL